MRNQTKMIQKMGGKENGKNLADDADDKLADQAQNQKIAEGGQLAAAAAQLPQRKAGVHQLNGAENTDHSQQEQLGDQQHRLPIPLDFCE